MEKVISGKKVFDSCSHFILPGEGYFRGYSLRFIHSRNLCLKQLGVLPTSIILSPGKLYDTYVGALKMKLDTKVYKAKI